MHQHVIVQFLAYFLTSCPSLNSYPALVCTIRRHTVQMHSMPRRNIEYLSVSAMIASSENNYSQRISSLYSFLGCVYSLKMDKMLKVQIICHIFQFRWRTQTRGNPTKGAAILFHGDSLHMLKRPLIGQYIKRPITANISSQFGFARHSSRAFVLGDRNLPVLTVKMSIQIDTSTFSSANKTDVLHSLPCRIEFDGQAKVAEFFTTGIRTASEKDGTAAKDGGFSCSVWDLISVTFDRSQKRAKLAWNLGLFKFLGVKICWHWTRHSKPSPTEVSGCGAAKSDKEKINCVIHSDPGGDLVCGIHHTDVWCSLDWHVRSRCNLALLWMRHEIQSSATITRATVTRMPV